MSGQTMENTGIKCPAPGCERTLRIVKEWGQSNRKPSRSFLSCREHGEQTGPQQSTGASEAAAKSYAEEVERRTREAQEPTR